MIYKATQTSLYNLTITILDIIHRLVFSFKNNVSETEIRPLFLCPFECVPPEDGEKIRFPKRGVLFKKTGRWTLSRTLIVTDLQALLLVQRASIYYCLQSIGHS
jgi:hypothetical protein